MWIALRAEIARIFRRLSGGWAEDDIAAHLYWRHLWQVEAMKRARREYEDARKFRYRRDAEARREKLKRVRDYYREIRDDPVRWQAMLARKRREKITRAASKKDD